jgi:tetratricopeptide (TPR) repeat protein
MANVVKHTEEKSSTTQPSAHGNRTEEFWQKNSKIIVIALAAVLLLVAGYFIYESQFKAPAELKAADAMWKAEDYYRKDSARLALNGDGPNAGFLKIMSRYSGTKAADLAKFYAGSCYIKLGDFKNAIKYLKDFKTDDKLIMVRATGLLADAYSETGKKSEAAENYKKAGTLFPDDHFNSSEYLFRAGLLYQDMGKNKEAIEMFKLIRDKYHVTERGAEIEKYLARLGEYN